MNDLQDFLINEGILLREGSETVDSQTARRSCPERQERIPHRGLTKLFQDSLLDGERRVREDFTTFFRKLFKKLVRCGEEIIIFLQHHLIVVVQNLVEETLFRVEREINLLAVKVICIMELPNQFLRCVQNSSPLETVINHPSYNLLYSETTSAFPNPRTDVLRAPRAVKSIILKRSRIFLSRALKNMY